MSFSFIFFLIFIGLIILFCFVLLSLNTSIVHIDLLFYEADMNLGLVLLASFLVGFLVTIALEVIYFSNKRGKKIE